MSGTFALSCGSYGGFYLTRSRRFCYRVCLGWVALTYIAIELDALMDAYAESSQAGGASE